MYTPLKADFFAGNRKRLKKKLAEKLPIIIAGNGLLQRTSDNAYSFTQDSNFWYLTGIDIPDMVLVIDVHETFVIVPDRSVSREAFDGKIDALALETRSGITAVYNEADGWTKIKDAIKSSRNVSCMLPNPPYDKGHGMYVNPARKRAYDRLRRITGNTPISDCRPSLAELRAIKQPEEIEQIKQAVKITKESLSCLNELLLGSTLTEGDLEARLSYEFRRRGSHGHAYQPIVAQGKNATTMHYVQNNAVVPKDTLVLIDAGAEIEHYAADITRVVCFGSPSRRQQSVINAVKSIQERIISNMKPGIKLRDLEKKAEQFIGEELVKLGVITDLGDKAQIRRFYPHAVSHFLGLDVHDVGDYNKPLRKGMVLTCEPGIYIPEEGIGVRLEDDILITQNGPEIL